MQKVPFIWMDGAFVPWEDAKVHVLSHSLHYGTAAWEGIRVYETENGPAVFRLKEHVDRLFYSVGVLEMDVPYSKEEFTEIILETLRKNELKQGYIRPIFYYGEKMGLHPDGAPLHATVACFGWGKWMPAHPITVQISDTIRIHPQSTVADAKISGHYINSMLPALAVRKTAYDEALLLDYEGYIAEGPVVNFFVVKDERLYTPPLGRILPGITRLSLMKIAEDLDYRVKEKAMSPDFAYGADEAFFSGTASEVTPIASIDGHVLGNGEEGPLTMKLKNAYLDGVYGRNPRYGDWLTLV